MANLKKQKVGSEETLYDGISKLPDSLLVQILSLMPTTKDAFRTCILSKRWHYLWTCVDTFIFSITNHNTRENLSFVDYVLTHSVSPKIKKFELDCTDCTDMYSYDQSIRCEYDSLVTRCLSFAVERKVENVVLWSFEDDVCTLPESLCTCSSLITLDVKYCTFDYYHPVISWKSLESIKFGYSVLYDDEIVNKLSGCPALETMELYNVEGSRRLEINSLILKRLKLKDYWFAHAGEDHCLEIFAPYLQHLEISGDLNDLTCRLLDVSSVVKAKLTFNIRCTKAIQGDNDEESDDEEEEDNHHDYHQVLYTLVQDNLQKLSCAAELRIGTWFIEVLCMLQFEGVLIPELKCKYLTLELHVEKFNLCGAAGLLRASPHVETLDIDIAITPFDSSWCQFELGYLAKGDNLDLDIWISSFVFPNLKSVKIASSHGVCLKYHSDRGYVKKLFKLSKFLLKNASVLVKFVIVSKRRRCKTCSKNCVSRYLFQLAEKLSDCTRSSTNFMIIFQE